MDLSIDFIRKSSIKGILKLQLKYQRLIRRSLDWGLGITSATTIFCLWLLTFILICRVDLASLSIWAIALIILGRTFLHTGLFIISHDAAHGTVFTPNRRINDGIGAIALFIYGLLPYQKFLTNHGLHHKYPASDQDPDFHDGRHSSMVAWYLSFMFRYIDRRQSLILFVGMTILFHGIRIGFDIPALNLLLFWILPLLLSSMQLFYFGTYLPHRGQVFSDRHHARSSNFSLLISFLTCYHFGYHWEHHEHPHLPWFRLPFARKNPKHKLI
jgi:beta-carotene ketolase (CrtW type)